MIAKEAYYISKLKECLLSRQRDNSQYSLRAFARDIGVHPGTLVKVFKGERRLSVHAAKKILDYLKLDSIERTLFLESLLPKRPIIDTIKIDSQDVSFEVDESHQDLMREWEHLAVHSLFDIEAFETTVQDVARCFSIPLSRAEEVIENLVKCGLLEMDSAGRLTRLHSDFKVAHHLQDVARVESHMAVAVDLDQLHEVQLIIQEFQQKIRALLKAGTNKSEVYQLAIQFYPLTKLNT